SRKSSSGQSTARCTWRRWSRMLESATTKSCLRSSTRTSSTSTTMSARTLTTSQTRRTVLYDRHLSLGGRMVDFGGWELPQQYSSIRDEHFAVRKSAGLFDISHMGRFRVSGDRALEYLQGLLTNDLDQIGPGRAQYHLMCNEQGGVLDDLVVYWGDKD